MTQELGPGGEISLTFSQKMYSRIFALDTYPIEAFGTQSELFEDSPQTFSARFISWKEGQLATFQGVSDPRDPQVIALLEKLSLFEVAKTAMIEITEAKPHGPVPRAQIISYWEWIAEKAKAASELYRHAE